MTMHFTVSARANRMTSAAAPGPALYEGHNAQVANFIAGLTPTTLTSSDHCDHTYAHGVGPQDLDAAGEYASEVARLRDRPAGFPSSVHDYEAAGIARG